MLFFFFLKTTKKSISATQNLLSSLLDKNDLGYYVLATIYAAFCVGALLVAPVRFFSLFFHLIIVPNKMYFFQRSSMHGSIASGLWRSPRSLMHYSWQQISYQYRESCSPQLYDLKM